MVSSFEDKLMGNPVGWLQELCMSRFWPPPSYHAENDDNVNRRKFILMQESVSLLHFNVIA